ncbi:putative bifunctional diguanylate cyclase/phosphodiesterase [Glaciecola sp. 1036]|uniref:putative bifunctional diguanylate cyclase/phosphodiesterase n=1 Tax=Alteromonadaceae TaxID=72275 RepID=UPI003D08285D
MHLSLIKSLGIADCIILKRLKDNLFEMIYAQNEWVSQLFKNLAVGQQVNIDSQSLFLDDFMFDANEYWRKQVQGQIESGIWTEITADGELYLEAIAAHVTEGQFLIIKNQAQLYHQQKETLQIARELLISNDEVIERHDYLSERIRSLLIESAEAKTELPILDAIRKADIGVLITDSVGVIKEVNPAAWKIFEKSPSNQTFDILATIKGLVDRQYGASEDILSGTTSWAGELYWHSPPTPHKWLKVNIHPVLNGIGFSTFWIFTISDISRVKYLLQTNEELALHDPLTGLPNRQFFWQELHQLVDNKQAVALLNIDIVNFRSVNELYGYLDGDDLLIQMVKRISAILQEGDFMTRVGADEFMIMRRLENASDPDTLNENQDNIEMLARDISNICRQPLYTKSNSRCELSVKIGVAHFPQNAINSEELLGCADLALSTAKASMSNDVVVYTEALKRKSRRRILLEEALKHAIEKDQFELFLQPIYDLHSKQIIKAEALLRWHLNGETISPEEFIPIAEKSELINTIGRWVFTQVCDILTQQKKAQIVVPISLNFSPKQIYDLNLIGFFRNVITQKNIAPNLLEIEVTEGVLINNYNKVKMFLKELKDSGISISVDDFGTGYCSLSYLKHLPIDTLKIDRSFIIDLANSEDDQAIVNAIIAMANNLKLKVIAEGVETPAQESYLINHDCHLVQGFLFGEPCSVADFNKLYQANH